MLPVISNLSGWATNLKEISDQLFFDKIERNYNKDFKFMIVEVDTEE